MFELAGRLGRALEHSGAGFEEGAFVEARGGVARVVRRAGPNTGSLVTSTPHPGVLQTGGNLEQVKVGTWKWISLVFLLGEEGYE